MKKINAIFSSSFSTVIMLTVFVWIASFSTASAQCSQPSNLNANNLTPTSVQLSWSAIQGAANYSLQYRLNTTTIWTTVNNVQGTNFTVSNLSQSTVYRWRVKASCSSYSSIALFNTGGSGNNASCSQPSNLNAVVTSNSTANISWSASPGAFSYTLQYRIQGIGAYTSVTFIPGLSTTISGLQQGATYEFRVRSSCSVYSSIALFTVNAAGGGTGGGSTSCSAPSNTNTVSTTSTSANVAWEAVAGAANYTVQYRLENATAFVTVGTFNVASAAITGLVPNSQYVWRVKANCSPYGSFVQFTTLASTTGGGSTGGGSTSCSAPSNTNTVSTTSTSANVAWEAVAGAANYTVQYRLENATTFVTVGTFTIASAAITGLVPNSQYVWRVKANCSPYGSFVQFTTPASATSGGGAAAGNSAACSAPSNTNVVSVTSTTVSVEWEPVAGSANYTVQYKLENAATYTTVGTFNTANALITGLMANREYLWRVKASCSPYGSDVQFSTLGTTTSNKSAYNGQDDNNNIENANMLKNKVTLSPNPAVNGFINVKSNNALGKIYINDATGKNVMVTELSSGESQIDVSTLKNGIYYFYIANSVGISAIEKIIITN
jgi:hypothetical protein